MTPSQLRGLLAPSPMTSIALGLIGLFLLVSFGAAVTGHYDSPSVRSWLDDIKYLAGLVGGGVAIARGLLALGDRQADGAVVAASLQADAQAQADIAAAKPDPVE